MYLIIFVALPYAIFSDINMCRNLTWSCYENHT